MQMTLTALPGIPLIRPGDDLAGLILSSVKEGGIELQSGDVLAVAQKVVSKAENRFVDLSQVEPSAAAMELAEDAEKDSRLVEVILSESREVAAGAPGFNRCRTSPRICLRKCWCGSLECGRG